MAEEAAEVRVAADAARGETDTWEKRYEIIREKRRKKFMDCFEVVKVKLDMVYKELTGTDELEGGWRFSAGVSSFSELHNNATVNRLSHCAGGARTLVVGTCLGCLVVFLHPQNNPSLRRRRLPGRGESRLPVRWRHQVHDHASL